MKRSGFLQAASLALLLFAGPALRADWTWQTNNTDVLNGSLGGKITLTDPLSTTPFDSFSNIVLATITVSAAGTSPESIVDGHYDLELTIFDGADFGVFNFSGMLTGTFSSGGAQVTASPVSPPSQTVEINGKDYTVTILGALPPQGPGATGQSSIVAYVSYEDGSGGGGIEKVPEPSTMVLSFLGLSVAGAASWRRRRRAA